MSGDLGKKVHFAGPGQWRSQADAAQEGTRPPAAALEPAEAVVSRGLDWAPEEYLLRAYNPHELRGPHGQWVHGAAHVPTLAGLGQTPGKGKRGEAQGPAEPSAADLGKMIADLQTRLAATEDRLRAEDTKRGDQLHAVVDQMRAEQHKVVAGNPDVKISGLSDEKRKELVRSLANVLGLIAVGLLVVATAGLALPPIAAAGVAVGPLIGGELIASLHEAHLRKQAARGK